MFAIAGKDGKISAVRIGTSIAVLGVVVVVVAVATYFIDQSARRSPLEIEPPSGANYIGQRTLTATSQRQFYAVPVTEMSVEDVASYYTDKLQAFDDVEDRPRCLRSPEEGAYPNYNPEAGEIPYQYLCIFDNSGFNTTQFTEVRIQPGVFNPDPDLNTEGLVVIQYEQTWTP